MGKAAVAGRAQAGWCGSIGTCLLEHSASHVQSTNAGAIYGPPGSIGGYTSSRSRPIGAPGEPIRQRGAQAVLAQSHGQDHPVGFRSNNSPRAKVIYGSKSSLGVGHPWLCCATDAPTPNLLDSAPAEGLPLPLL